jgi:hypothetical protein
MCSQSLLTDGFEREVLEKSAALLNSWILFLACPILLNHFSLTHTNFFDETDKKCYALFVCIFLFFNAQQSCLVLKSLFFMLCLFVLPMLKNCLRNCKACLLFYHFKILSKQLKQQLANK